MKANVPENIYVHKSQYWGLMANEENTTKDDIEYIRKDSFIKKAIEFIQKHTSEIYSDYQMDKEYWIEDFKKYIGC